MPPPPSLHDTVADALGRSGTSRLFGLPGGGPNLDLIGAAADRGIPFVLAHGESEAAIMAATHGLLTGTPTAVVATRGPGATSLVNGVAQATMDRFPLVAITDTVPSEQAHRVAHQRVDQRALLAPVTKESITVGLETPSDRLAETIAATTTWPFGAVHFDCDPTAAESSARKPAEHEAADPCPGCGAIDQARHLVAAARSPIVIVGVEAAAQAGVIRPLLDAFGAPVLCTYQAIGTVPTASRLFAGLFTNGALERPVLDAADLVVTIGLDPVEPIPAAWDRPVPVVELSAVANRAPYLPATVEVVGNLATTASAVLAAGAHVWADDAGTTFRRVARERIDACAVDGNGRLGPVELMQTLAPAVPESATVTVDAGAHFLAVMPLIEVPDPYRLLISNGLATMGFAVPAAIGAAIARPGCPVVALTGDGGLSMVLAELETIARLALPITIVCFNDAALSLISLKQRQGQGDRSAVQYRPVDYAAVASASGVPGTVVESADELGAALATGWGRPRLLDVQLDPASYPELIRATRG